MKCIKIVREPRNDGYVKAIILTAIATAIAETAAIVAGRVVTTFIRKKKEDFVNDDGFDIRIDDGDCKVTFEASETLEDDAVIDSEEETESGEAES